MSAKNRQRARCNSKTKVGNIYGSFKEARLAAMEMRKRTGAFIRAYQCEWCDLFHIGRGYRVEKWRNVVLDQVIDKSGVQELESAFSNP